MFTQIKLDHIITVNHLNDDFVKYTSLFKRYFINHQYLMINMASLYLDNYDSSTMRYIKEELITMVTKSDHILELRSCFYLIDHLFKREDIFIKKSEKPDFIIRDKAITIGIEVTNAIRDDIYQKDQLINYVYYQNMAKQHSYIESVALLETDDQIQINKLSDLANCQLSYQKVMERIIDKVNKAQNYQLFDQNHLIVDCLNDPCLKDKNALMHLNKVITNNHKIMTSKYDHIYVINQKYGRIFSYNLQTGECVYTRIK